MNKPQHFGLNDAYLNLKYCPECGKELERNPNSTYLACFLHGDFNIVDGKIVWDYTNFSIIR